LGSLKKELLELFVSLAADLFDFEVAPRSTSLFGGFGDNSRNRFPGRDWFFRCIAFDIGAIEMAETSSRALPMLKNRRQAQKSYSLKCRRETIRCR